MTQPLFWAAAALCIVAEAAILRSAFAARGKIGDSGPIPHSRRGTEMMWAVIPAIMLALLLGATWRAIQ